MHTQFNMILKTLFLDGLQLKFKQGEARLSNMKCDIGETINEEISIQVEKGFQKLRQMEDLLKKEIENYIQIYANTFTPQMQVVFLVNYE